MHAHKPRLEQLKLIRLLASIYRIKAVRVLVPVLIIAFVYWEGQHELKGVRLAKTLRELRLIPAQGIMQMMGTALAAVALMSAYDFLIRAHYRMKIGVWSTFRYSWIANTFNNLIGFAGLAGVGLRTLLYKKSGVPAAVLTPAIVFLSPLMITGLSLLSWASIFGILPAEGLFHKHRWLVFAVWGMALYLPFFIMLQRSSLFAKWINRGEGKTPWMTVYASVGSSLLEWLSAGITFSVIAKHILGGAPFQPMMSLYVIAAIAGILSMAPGGIGAFDLIALLGIQQMGYSSERAMAVLVIFRLFYFVIPWLIGLVLAALEIGQQGIRLLRSSALETPLNTWQRIWTWPGQYTFLSDLGVWALGKLVLAAGLLLLLSAATPELLYRLRFMEELLSLPIMRVSHHLAVVIGFMLVLLSRGISLRIRRAYIWSSITLALGAVFAFTKGFDYEEALFLLLVAFLLWISRARFYRVSAPISRQSLLWWLLLTSGIALSYYLLASYSHRGFFKALRPGAPTEWLQQHSHFAFSAVGGLVTAWLLFSMIVALRPNRRAEALTAPPDMDRLRRYLKSESGNALTHMLFTGDKSFYWAQDGKVMLPFARVRDKAVVLGDPLGPKGLVNDAISEFRTEADRYGLSAVFYQATPDYLPIYHEQGYHFFKLGEEALVPLDKFTLSGKGNSDLRSVKNRFVREGCKFELAEPPFAAELLKELHSISEEWLRGRAEKGFSLGWFDESYLQLAPIALLRDAGGAVIAFASLAPGYDGGVTISIDLMRHRLKSPNGTMDFLFISLLEWAKAQGYERFNLGNAPLSSVGRNPGALREEKMAHVVFKHGGHWYGFLGLRRYKEKFSPEWEPRYLAYPVSLSLPVLTLDLVRLVSRKPKSK
ncbi:bifunctional lysylphosphatidylglycerol flippase/synthetase MprF [Paenibacillus durus]|uniref:Phosphatidylglycerol lysyltransferase n=1 Tax=Paenibacillus durus ATCC 35681 TaxID=1333534 RepID=A0A0F7FDX0_PAEDU|nr:bifunctional lysylphosphatidylglycerol flippase/synthetase MprF [Paenibacillus durus]AKG36694.1 lysyl transferase [Paenibacillus durus ATCC 35681]